MTRDDLIQMIRSEINELAFDTLRNNNGQSVKSKAKPRGLTEDELEYALFYGGNKPNKDGTLSTTIAIKENFESGIPKINSSDVEHFENETEKMLQGIDGASIIFDTQSNGYSLKMWVGPNGIEAGASGVVEMGNKGRFLWSYSLQNGLTVTTDNLVVDSGNSELMSRLYYNYDAWQKEWREKLTMPQGKALVGDEEAPQQAPQQAPADSPEEDAGEELPV